ncbi:hypothetical protein B0I32_1651, partial [Nonomuraea fuscirosea]
PRSPLPAPRSPLPAPRSPLPDFRGSGSQGFAPWSGGFRASCCCDPSLSAARSQLFVCGSSLSGSPAPPPWVMASWPECRWSASRFPASALGSRRSVAGLPLPKVRSRGPGSGLPDSRNFPFLPAACVRLFPVARWPGGPVARWPGGPVARWLGGSVARWLGGSVARLLGVVGAGSRRSVRRFPFAALGGLLWTPLLAPCGRGPDFGASGLQAAVPVARLPVFGASLPRFSLKGWLWAPASCCPVSCCPPSGRPCPFPVAAPAPSVGSLLVVGFWGSLPAQVLPTPALAVVRCMRGSGFEGVKSVIGAVKWVHRGRVLPKGVCRGLGSEVSVLAALTCSTPPHQHQETRHPMYMRRNTV